jgi:hypothetical protein
MPLIDGPESFEVLALVNVRDYPTGDASEVMSQVLE